VRSERLARLLLWDATTRAARLDVIGYALPVQRVVPSMMSSEVPGFLPGGIFSQYQDFADALQAYQASTFLVPSLVRHDRLSQPAGLEVESPFLRAPVVDLALRLPRSLRYLDGSKPVLRALCDRYLPPEVSRWPKLGFPVPWQGWVREAFPRGTCPAPRLGPLLPEGFLMVAEAAGDAEALWTAATLEALVEEFRPRLPTPTTLPRGGP
jgi:hypothetical protein